MKRAANELTNEQLTAMRAQFRESRDAAAKHFSNPEDLKSALWGEVLESSDGEDVTPSDWCYAARVVASQPWEYFGSDLYSRRYELRAKAEREFNARMAAERGERGR